MKHFFLFFLIFSIFELTAQTENNFILKTNIGYSYIHNDNGDVSSQSTGLNYGEKINDLNFSVTAGKNFRSHFNYGLGLSYNTIKKEVNPENDIPELNNSAVYIGAFSYVNSVETSRIISPIIYFQYYSNFSERIYITFDLYSKYDFDLTKTESTLYNPNFIIYSYDEFDQFKTEIKRQYLNVGMFPSVRINLYKNFGMDFSFGTIEYRIKTVDSRTNIDKKTTEFNLDFNPENWKIGFYVTF